MENEPKMESSTEIENRIEKYQKKWKEKIIEIGKAGVCKSEKKVKELLNKMLKELYDFQNSVNPKILFKPTKASEHPYRITKNQTISYFIGGKYFEDKGFALNPWKDVHFGEYYFMQQPNQVFVMGEYTFTDYQESKTIVDYTFGYRKDGASLKIFLHHSSLRYE
ncbi:MAG: hypothetical protein ACI8ZM_002997 [Crocinitomix sp.]|jgi:hypothetical protein